MNAIQRNQAFLSDLFAGKAARRVAIIMEFEYASAPDDFAISERPVSDFVPGLVENYRRAAARQKLFDDDGVPYVKLTSNTGIFAAGFGCQIHRFEGSNAAAIPFVHTAAEADALKTPKHENVRTLARILEMARLVRKELGPNVPIGVPDIQSPFDVAALIWNKEEMFLAMLETPDAVQRLVWKCHALLTSFLDDFRREFGNVNMCHCPTAWAPPEYGCWLSEDEVGAISTGMFDQFCLPVLTDLSRRYGGLFVHCCAAADHQYGGFKKIPNLRGLNRVFQAPGAAPAVKAFSDQTVLMTAWLELPVVLGMLELSQPNTRWLLNMPYQPDEEAKRTYEALREHRLAR
ncbi:MAG TPA: uroporphyrinogen decarboxylase family protein [Planctomycetota bacterium]|jgi:hypothetical protein